MRTGSRSVVGRLIQSVPSCRLWGTLLYRHCWVAEWDLEGSAGNIDLLTEQCEMELDIILLSALKATTKYLYSMWAMSQWRESTIGATWEHFGWLNASYSATFWVICSGSSVQVISPANKLKQWCSPCHHCAETPSDLLSWVYVSRYEMLFRSSGKSVFLLQDGEARVCWNPRADDTQHAAHTLTQEWIFAAGSSAMDSEKVTWKLGDKQVISKAAPLWLAVNSL